MSLGLSFGPRPEQGSSVSHFASALHFPSACFRFNFNFNFNWKFRMPTWPILSLLPKQRHKDARHNRLNISLFCWFLWVLWNSFSQSTSRSFSGATRQSCQKRCYSPDHPTRRMMFSRTRLWGSGSQVRNFTSVVTVSFWGLAYYYSPVSALVMVLWDFLIGFSKEYRYIWRYCTAKQS